MEDEGNVVVEAAAAEQPTVTPTPASDISGDNITIVNGNVAQPTNDSVGAPLSAPIAETTGADIGVLEPKPMAEAPELLSGHYLDDLSIIEMMNQQSRSVLFNELELANAGFDSQLASAKAYNEGKQRSLALDEYYVKHKAAQVEAAHTGYFLAPEDRDMVTQYNVAKNMVGRTDLTNAQRRKAEGTISSVDAYFKAKGISTKGVETLDKILNEMRVATKRSANAVEGAKLGNMIKAMDLANLKTIYSSLETGESKESIAARLKGLVDRDDVYSIAEAYYKGEGENSQFYNAINTLSDEDFARLATPTGVFDEQKREVYTFKRNNGETINVVFDEKLNSYVESTFDITKVSGPSVNEVTIEDVNDNPEELKKFEAIAELNWELSNADNIVGYKVIDNPLFPGVERTVDGNQKELLVNSKQFISTMLTNNTESVKLDADAWGDIKDHKYYTNIPNNKDVAAALDAVTISHDKPTVFKGLDPNNNMTVNSYETRTIQYYEPIERVLITEQIYLDPADNSWKTSQDRNIQKARDIKFIVTRVKAR